MAVLLAAVLVALIGMTGLAVDFGFASLERRVLQNAVDAAAVTGATDLVNGFNPTTDVQTMATRNNIAVSTTVDCEYVDNSSAITGPCSGAPSGTTSGVKVTATNDRDTYFMRVLGVPTVTVSATSTARVFAWSTSSTLTQDAGKSLFLVCGYDTLLSGNPKKTLSILRGTKPGSSPWLVNDGTDGTPNAVGKEFVIHDPGVADCDIHDSDFKGLNSSSGSNITLPNFLFTESGTRAGPVNGAVGTTNGCAGGLYSDDPGLDNCVMLIPIFVEPIEKIGGDWKVRSVMWLPFKIRRQDKNTHYGTLLSNVPMQTNPGTLLAPWTKNTKSTLTAVKLVN